MRSTDEAINDHLEQRKDGSVEEDLRRNYAEVVTLFIADGPYHGHDGVRALAERLRGELPEAAFEYQTVLVHGDVALLEWTGEGDGARGPRRRGHVRRAVTARSWPRPSNSVEPR
jgi:hypothetical protein